MVWGGHLANTQADFTAAQSLNKEGRRLAKQLGARWTYAFSLLSAAGIALRRGELEQAEALLQEMLGTSRSAGYRMLEYYAQMCLGLVALERGDRVQAAANGEQSLALAERLGYRRGSANSLYVMGRAALSHGEHTRGGALLEKSLELYRECVDYEGTHWALIGLGHLVLDQGDMVRAAHLFHESITLAHETGDRFELARGLEGLVGVLAETAPTRSVRLAAAASALRGTLGAVAHPWERERLDNWLGLARRLMSESAYTGCWNDGVALSVDEAVRLALQAVDLVASRLDGGNVHPTSDVSATLSARERDVARLIGRGCTNRQIAERLVIARRTVDNHVQHIFDKLAVS